MKIPKSVLVALIGALLVTSVGFIFLATRPEGDRTTFSSGSGPVARARVSELLGDGNIVPALIANEEEVLGLLSKGETAFVSRGKSGQPVLLMCPGHRDFVKSVVALLSDNENWIEVK